MKRNNLIRLIAVLLSACLLSNSVSAAGCPVVPGAHAHGCANLFSSQAFAVRSVPFPKVHLLSTWTHVLRIVLPDQEKVTAAPSNPVQEQPVDPVTLQWREAFRQAIAAGGKRGYGQLNPDLVVARGSQPPWLGAHEPGRFAFTAQDILDILPPIPANAQVSIQNSPHEIKIDVLVLPNPLTMLGAVHYLSLTLILKEETKNSQKSYQVVLDAGSLNGPQVVADLKAQRAPPLHESPSFLFFSALLFKLEHFPWEGPAWFVVRYSDDGDELWDRLGGFEKWGLGRRRKLSPVATEVLAPPPQTYHAVAFNSNGLSILTAALVVAFGHYLLAMPFALGLLARWFLISKIIWLWSVLNHERGHLEADGQWAGLSKKAQWTLLFQTLHRPDVGMAFLRGDDITNAYVQSAKRVWVDSPLPNREVIRKIALAGIKATRGLMGVALAMIGVGFAGEILSSGWMGIAMSDGLIQGGLLVFLVNGTLDVLNRLKGTDYKIAKQGLTRDGIFRSPTDGSSRPSLLDVVGKVKLLLGSYGWSALLGHPKSRLRYESSTGKIRLTGVTWKVSFDCMVGARALKAALIAAGYPDAQIASGQMLNGIIEVFVKTEKHWVTAVPYLQPVDDLDLISSQDQWMWTPEYERKEGTDKRRGIPFMSHYVLPMSLLDADHDRWLLGAGIGAEADGLHFYFQSSLLGDLDANSQVTDAYIHVPWHLWEDAQRMASLFDPSRFFDLLRIRRPEFNQSLHPLIAAEIAKMLHLFISKLYIKPSTLQALSRRSLGKAA